MKAVLTRWLNCLLHQTECKNATGDLPGEIIIGTSSGALLDLRSPFPENYTKEQMIGDIAHSLALQCRFNGHTQTFYSVAEHCVRVSKLVPPQYALQALLHDAAEAFVSDVITPVKNAFPLFHTIEEAVHREILLKVGCPAGDAQADTWIKRADLIMLHAENRIFRPKCAPFDFAPQEADKAAYYEKFYPCGPVAAETLFLRRYRRLAK